MKIYFIRHAESIENSISIHKGSSNPLSKNGKKQVSQLSVRFENIHINHIYSSPDKRAVETSMGISKSIGINLDKLENLKELENPTDILGLPYDHPQAIKVNELIKKNFYKANWKFSDEESYIEFRKRIVNLLQDLLKYDENSEVICVTHRITMKMILAVVIFGNKVSAKQFLKFREHIWLENTGISIFEHTNKYDWSLLAWNDTHHLYT